jgi:hypothetical protein
MEDAMEGWSYEKSADGCMYSRGSQRQGWKSSGPQTTLDSTIFQTCDSDLQKKGPLYGPCFGAVCTVFSYMGVKKRHPFLNGFRGFVRFPQGQVGLAVEQFLASDCPAGQDSVGLQS